MADRRSAMTDQATRQEDWIRRRTWDGPMTLAGLLRVIGDDADSIRHFLTLPSAEPLPRTLHVQLMERLEQHMDERPPPK